MKYRHDLAERRTVARTIALLFLPALVHTGCGGGGEDAPSGPDAAVLSDADAPDAAPVDKAAPCASQFGDALTAAFGRLDGTVVAVVPPAHPTCPMPNSDHVVLQGSMG